jgi:peptidoglycan/xylan/chitin deacetylase (PgdA/CDA1 family)
MTKANPLQGPERDLVGYGPNPPKVVWPNGATVAFSPIIAIEEGSEFGHTWNDGRNEGIGELSYTLDAQYRDLAAESVYEYGSRAGVWRLLRLLDEYSLKLTFFTTATAIEKNPAVGESIKAGGHEPHGHGYRWIEYWKLPEDEEREHIHKAVTSIEKTCGTRPVGWYCRYGPSIHTREILVEEGGFRYDSMAYNDDLPYFTEVNGKQHLVVPYNALPYNDIRYILPQGFGSPSEFVDTCKRALDEYRKEGQAGYPKMMSLGLHARYAGQPARLSGVRELFEYAMACGDVWIARRCDIADWWHEHWEEF